MVTTSPQKIAVRTPRAISTSETARPKSVSRAAGEDEVAQGHQRVLVAAHDAAVLEADEGDEEADPHRARELEALGHGPHQHPRARRSPSAARTARRPRRPCPSAVCQGTPAPTQMP